MNTAPSRPSPTRRDPYGFGDSRDSRHDRSPIRGSPRREPRDGRNGRDARDTRDMRDPRDSRDMRDHRDSRDMREHRDSRSMRDARDMRDFRDFRDLRDSRDFRDHRDPVYDRYRDMRDSRDPMYRREGSYDRYLRVDDYCRRKSDSYFDRYRDSYDGRGPPGPESQSRTKERLKREERRREELYRQYFDEIQRRFDAERPVDCSVIVVNKQTKDYAESVGRKVRDLGMVVDLIFLNTEVSLSQALEDVSRGGSPFAIVITQQHQIHRSCTVNIMFGTPQEHRNMPQADAMVLVARNYERYKNECREKEHEEIARQAAKMADEAIIQERERGGPEEGVRGGHPPAIQSLINLLADNRYLTAEETDKIINYLRERKERLMRSSTDSLPGTISRQPLGATSGASLKTQPSSQPLQSGQALPSAPPTPAVTSTSQQELQAKILSLFNSGTVAANSSSASPSVIAGSAQNQNFSTAANSQPQQRSQASGSQPPNILGQAGSARNMGPRPGAPSQGLFGQPSSRLASASKMASQRPVSSTGINFDNPSVQKALDTLIQSGPALSHLVSQTTAQVGQPQAPLGSYQRHY
ncbi:nuclear receptor coactivator 5 isoform X1 [Trichechus manatus latirostris]|uniref:Nuclear receptor coactivator 5 n=2 Tax=Trichechus manatus latirostris TaxID=127582 RepID=A0A2Y9D971_TRIMA|nr:nuclear receptor coactivator 5 isoform X1 [Trichechus manatus latirostris]XP_023598965.1 nuclear receptor coactivator 5 isoform X1 [Trichechus manatus latirostris]XP_023598968.1 nuclear receptor coactivator 5 isoform X1 [Trichechus manatus latirostris]XP_023598975.1 nuclear receptor coactivator 5 isoform X1 [Trichechus manatus latirostris]